MRKKPPAVVYESSLTILPGSQASAISLVVNGQEVFTDVPPELKNDRLWVPVRALAEALGCQVQYEASNERILVRPASGDVISLAALPSSDRGRFGREIIVGRPLPAKNGRSSHGLWIYFPMKPGIPETGWTAPGTHP